MNGRTICQRPAAPMISTNQQPAFVRQHRAMALAASSRCPPKPITSSQCSAWASSFPVPPYQYRFARDGENRLVHAGIVEIFSTAAARRIGLGDNERAAAKFFGNGAGVIDRARPKTMRAA